jgi:hypothetical protein
MEIVYHIAHEKQHLLLLKIDFKSLTIKWQWLWEDVRINENVRNDFSTKTMVLILTPLEGNVFDVTTVSTEFAGKYFGNVSFISLKARHSQS